MALSSRNRLNGTVRAVHTGQVNSTVDLNISPTVSMLATLPRTLQTHVKPHQNVAIYIDPNRILISTQHPNAISARNVLHAQVEHITQGNVRTQIGLRLDDTTLLYATLSQSVYQSHLLKEGQEVFAIIKSNDMTVEVLI